MNNKSCLGTIAMCATIISCIIALLLYFHIQPPFLFQNDEEIAIEVNMNLLGGIGEAQCKEFIMDGTTGHYTFKGADNVQRTLKLNHYNKKTGKCIIEAYLRDKYIGRFDGLYENSSSPHKTYKGKFISVKPGVSLDFYLYEN